MLPNSDFKQEEVRNFCMMWKLFIVWSFYQCELNGNKNKRSGWIWIFQRELQKGLCLKPSIPKLDNLAIVAAQAQIIPKDHIAD